MNWFQGCITPEEIKKRYRQLAMQHHPDKGGSNETMAEINDAYHVALEACHGYETVGSDGESHTYYYNRDVEQAVMDKIADLLRHRMEGVEIWLVGTWVWVRGNTKPYRAVLKAEGCRWHSKRGCWYFKPYKHRTRYNRNADFLDLAAMYGARVFEAKEDDRNVARA